MSPTGTVTFIDTTTGTTLGSGTLSGGTATFDDFKLSGQRQLDCRQLWRRRHVPREYGLRESDRQPGCHHDDERCYPGARQSSVSRRRSPQRLPSLRRAPARRRARLPLSTRPRASPSPGLPVSLRTAGVSYGHPPVRPLFAVGTNTIVATYAGRRQLHYQQRVGHSCWSIMASTTTAVTSSVEPWNGLAFPSI